MIKAIVIDDEQDARETIKNIVNNYSNKVQVIDEANNVSSGLELIKKVNPDLVYLDINMPDGTGFDLLSKIDNYNFQVIFTTAHDTYAIKAFKFSAIEYLLKPVDPEELLKASEKASKTIDNKIVQDKILNFLSQQKAETNSTIVLSTSESIYIIKINEIIRCKADVNYTEFYLTDDRKILVSKPLKEYVELLSDHSFFRPHQSHLINTKFITQYNKKDGGYIIMSDNSQVPVSKRNKESLLK